MITDIADIRCFYFPSLCLTSAAARIRDVIDFSLCKSAQYIFFWQQLYTSSLLNRHRDDHSIFNLVYLILVYFCAAAMGLEVNKI